MALARSLLLRADMNEQGYNYDTFRKAMMLRDMHFPGGPRPGEEAPPFDLRLVGGGRFKLAGARGQAPVLIEFASIT